MLLEVNDAGRLAAVAHAARSIKKGRHEYESAFAYRCPRNEPPGGPLHFQCGNLMTGPERLVIGPYGRKIFGQSALRMVLTDSASNAISRSVQHLAARRHSQSVCIKQYYVDFPALILRNCKVPDGTRGVVPLTSFPLRSGVLPKQADRSAQVWTV